MRLCHITIIATLFTSLTPPVFANSKTAQLQLHGTVTPSACTLTLQKKGSQQGGKTATLNLGSYTPTDPAATTTLDAQNITLTFDCHANILCQFELTAQDMITHRVGLGPQQFALIATTDKRRIGSYTLTAKDGEMIFRENDGYMPFDTEDLENNKKLVWQVKRPGAKVTTTLQVQPTIDNNVARAFSTVTPYEGQVQLTVDYLGNS